MLTTRSLLLTICLSASAVLSGCEASNRTRRTVPFERGREGVVLSAEHGVAPSAGESDTGLSVWLSTDQVDALPSDPRELLHDLQMMAGIGAIVRVDGVDGRMPPAKAAIAAIHITRLDVADGTVLTIIDVVTKFG